MKRRGGDRGLDFFPCGVSWELGWQDLRLAGACLVVLLPASPVGHCRPGSPGMNIDWAKEAGGWHDYCGLTSGHEPVLDWSMRFSSGVGVGQDQEAGRRTWWRGIKW